MPSSAEPIPVDKVGVAILRKKGDHYEALVVQVIPKNKGELPSMGLVRGTRRFWDGAQDAYVDANRKGQVPPKDVRWEPDYQNIAVEMEEEAGLVESELKRHTVYAMGEAMFPSGTKEPYPIRWFTLVLDDAAQASLAHTGPGEAPHFLPDALKTEWMSIERMKELAQVTDVTKDRVSPGYIEVVENAIAGIKANRFPVLTSTALPSVAPQKSHPRINTTSEPSSRSF